MKKTVLSVVCIMMGIISASAQSIDGFEMGSYYSPSQISDALHHSRQVNSDNGYQMYISGNSSFSFDFTGAFESNDGRFAAADICDDSHVVKFPFGEFKVGDSLADLLHLRANLTFSGYKGNVCEVAYVNQKGHKISALVQFGSGKVITEIYQFSTENLKKQKKEETQRNAFYAASSEIDIDGNTLEAGNSIDRILTLGVDVEFNGLGNGICKIIVPTLWGKKEYLVRYGMDTYIKEILPL